ncbi:transporter major facilitator family protein [Clostridium sp. CAG:452]|jgi:membrane protein|nr:transporter major facilitator family protein [Clostridium sp. CAG:452]
MKEEKLTKSAIGIMGSLLINNVLYMFVNTFMVAYFITLTNYDYKQISIYYVLSFIAILLTFLTFGRIIKNKNQVWVFRSGIIAYCLYILILAFLKEKIVTYFAPLGFFYGIVQGLIWVAAHTLVNEHTQNNTNKFISFKSIISKILKIFFPIVFGVSIELTSFSYVAKIVILLSITQFIFSLFIEDKAKTYDKKYNLKEYINLVKNNDKFKTVYKLCICDGIVNYLLETLIVILTVMTFKTTISLGVITTITAICSILSVYIFQYKLKSNWKILKICNIMMISSVLLLLINISKPTIIIYNICTAIFLVILSNTGDTKRYEIVSENEIVVKDYIVEHQVVCEAILNITRIIAYILLFVISLFNNIVLFKILLLLVTIVILIYSKLLIKLKK